MMWFNVKQLATASELAQLAGRDAGTLKDGGHDLMAVRVLTDQPKYRYTTYLVDRNGVVVHEQEGSSP